MQRVLFLALEFAPVQQTGAFRSIKFVKYLRSFGIEPIVVTIATEEASRTFGAPIDMALLDELPEGTEIHYLRSLERSNGEGRFARAWRLLTTASDGFYRRYRDALAHTIDGIGTRHHIDAVYASLPPFGAGRLAVDAARALSAPLIIDMRDAWSEFGAAPFPTRLHHTMVIREERSVLSSAHRVVVVTPELGELYLAAHPALDPARIVVLPNGFDGDAPLAERATCGPAAQACSIAYVGSYYYDPRHDDRRPWYRRPPHRWLHHQPKRDSWLHRSPEFFFRAWERLLATDPAIGNRIRFHHIGRVPDWLGPMAARHGVLDRCVFHGTVPSSELPALLGGMSAMLSTSLRPEHGRDYCLASKTFDYVAAGKPIIGFVVEGAQRDFLVRSGMAVIADPDQPADGAAKLRELARGAFTPKPDHEFLARYHRRRTAGRLARVIADIAPVREHDAGTRIDDVALERSLH